MASRADAAFAAGGLAALLTVGCTCLRLDHPRACAQPHGVLQLEGAKEVHHHELRLRMDAAIGRTPPLVDGELQVPFTCQLCKCCPCTI